MLWNTVAQTVELGWDFLCAGHPVSWRLSQWPCPCGRPLDPPPF